MVLERAARKNQTLDVHGEVMVIAIIMFTPQNYDTKDTIVEESLLTIDTRLIGKVDKNPTNSDSDDDDEDDDDEEEEETESSSKEEEEEEEQSKGKSIKLEAAETKPNQTSAALVTESVKLNSLEERLISMDERLQSLERSIDDILKWKTSLESTYESLGKIESNSSLTRLKKQIIDLENKLKARTERIQSQAQIKPSFSGVTLKRLSVSNQQNRRRKSSPSHLTVANPEPTKLSPETVYAEFDESTKAYIKDLMLPEKFQHILRILNTNIDGQRKIVTAMCSIKGIGRRYATLVCKKADIDITKRAGELSEDEVEKLVTVMSNPRQYKIPVWFLNRQRDVDDGKSAQLMSGALETKLREDLERLKRIRSHRGLRHYWGLRVRGQHTKTTGRRGRTVGVLKKKP